MSTSSLPPPQACVNHVCQRCGAPAPAPCRSCASCRPAAAPRDGRPLLASLGQCLAAPPPASPTALGRKLRALRLDHGLSIKRLAALAAVSQCSVARAEAGVTVSPRPWVLAALATALGVSPQALTEGGA